MALSASAKADLASDATAIVEQLMEDDVATQVVPNAAQHFPVTCDLMPASLYALKDKRYNGFSGVVRNELADMAGFLVVLSVDGRDMTQLPGNLTYYQQTVDVLTALTSPLGGALTKPASINPSTTCVFDNKPVHQPSQSVATSVIQACAKTQPSMRQELACAAGVAVRDAASGGSVTLSSDGQRALVAVAAQIVLNNAPVAGAIDWPAAPASFGQVVTALNRAIATPNDVLDCASRPPANQPPCNTANTFIHTVAVQVTGISAGSSSSLPQMVAATIEFGTTVGLGANPSLTALQNIVQAGSASALQVVLDIQAKNYGAATGHAIDSLNGVIDAACGPASKDVACTDLGKDVRTFIKAAAVYAVDAETAGVTATVSADFRTAAVDVIEDAGGQGIHRRTFAFFENGSSQWPSFIFPDFSLRAALRPGFAAPTSTETSSSALMTYASMDWPNVRWHFYPPRGAKKVLWWGGDISLFDLFGPIIELAGRSSTLDYDKNVGAAFGLAFVVPRVEMEFALPDLTKNLVLGFGGAVRFYRADQTTAATPGGTVTAAYCIVGQSGCRDGSFNPNNLEGTIFVKYVP